MPIKQSELEKKWYYQGAKVFFWVMQGVVALSTITLKSDGSISIVFDLMLGFVIYWAIMAGIWKIFIALKFGKVEKDSSNRLP